MSFDKSQSKLHIGMRYKGVIRQGGQATTMLPMLFSPDNKTALII